MNTARESREGLPPRRDGREAVEFLLVLVLCPLTFLAAALQYPSVEPAHYDYYRRWFFDPGTTAIGLLQSLGMGLLAAYLVVYHWPELARRWEEGLRRDVARQAAAAAGLFAGLTAAWLIVEAALWKLAGQRLPSNEWMFAVTWVQRLEVLGRSAVNGPAEELLRAYLVSRAHSLSGRGGLAVLLSAAIFASYHLYQGWGVVVFYLAVGLLTGWIYWRKNWLLALMLWHFLADMAAAVPLSWLHAVERSLGLPE